MFGSHFDVPCCFYINTDTCGPVLSTILNNLIVMCMMLKLFIQTRSVVTQGKLCSKCGKFYIEKTLRHAWYTHCIFPFQTWYSSLLLGFVVCSISWPNTSKSWWVFLYRFVPVISDCLLLSMNWLLGFFFFVCWILYPQRVLWGYVASIQRWEGVAEQEGEEFDTVGGISRNYTIYNYNWVSLKQYISFM